jgi:DNA-binding CsgD family transcriptional regulator
MSSPGMSAPLAPVQKFPLTAREREVAVLIAHGLTNRQVAARLVIAVRTADNHLQHIFDKLGLSARAQVAAWVAMQGMLGHRASLHTLPPSSIG